MRMTPGQIALRCYVGMGTPLHSGDGIIGKGSLMLDGLFGNNNWPKDPNELLSVMIKDDIGGVCYQNGHKSIGDYLINGRK